MPFELDAALVQRARDLIEDQKKIGWKRRDRLNELIGEVEDAARLANGPLPDRSEHWRQKALLAQRALREEIERC